MAEQEERLEQSLALIRRLIAEVRRHEDDYHCRTNEGLLREAEEFLGRNRNVRADGGPQRR